MLFALLACDGGPNAPVEPAAPAGRVDVDSGLEAVTPWSHPLATPEARALLQGLIDSGVARDMTEAVTLVAISDESSDEAGEVGPAVWVVEREANGEKVAEEPEPTVDIDPALEPWLAADAAPDELVPVVIQLDWLGTNPAPVLLTAILPAIGSGLVDDAVTYQAEKVRLYDARVAAGDALLDVLTENLALVGGTVTSRSPWSASADVLVPAGALAKLPSLLPTHSMSLLTNDPGKVDCDIDAAGDRGYTIDGNELADINQATQYYDAGAYGLEVQFAVLEPSGDEIHIRHEGFDTTGGINRVTNCTPPSCSNTDFTLMNDPGASSAHATGVASILVGDVTRGQASSEPSPLPPEWRGARSGAARRAVALGFTTDRPFFEGTVTHPISDFDIVTMSASMKAFECEGANANPWNATANAVFKAGIAYFKSAGNDDNDQSPAVCSVGGPAAALGAFGGERDLPCAARGGQHPR